MLCRILAAVDLEPRVRLAPYDNHDDVLDATEAQLTAEQQAARNRTQDALLADLQAS